MHMYSSKLCSSFKFSFYYDRIMSALVTCLDSLLHVECKLHLSHTLLGQQKDSRVTGGSNEDR